jgi:hypothetical protein
MKWSDEAGEVSVCRGVKVSRRGVVVWWRCG